MNGNWHCIKKPLRRLSKGLCVQQKSTIAGTQIFRAKKTPEQHQFSSLIRTVTVGSGISPDQPQYFFETLRVADFHRRWGISPRPEESPYICIFNIAQKMEVCNRQMYTIDGLDFVQVFENGRKTASGIVFFQKQVDMD